MTMTFMDDDFKETISSWRNEMKQTWKIALLTVLFVMVSNAAWAMGDLYQFELKWGSEGSGDGQFLTPRGVVIDSGNVFVVEEGNARVQKFDSDGNFITKWGTYGTDTSQFVSPSGIATDSSGFIYVADTYNHRIQEFDSDGNFITKWGSAGSTEGHFGWPFGVAIDPSGNVYVVDRHNHNVQKFDSNHNFIVRWGSFGTADGQFRYPEGIAIDPWGYLYVADSYNHRIQKFDSNGNFVTKWGSQGSGNGQFNFPEFVAVASSGDVYVADRNNNRIQTFDSDGNFVTKWGTQGSDDGQFIGPQGATIDTSGNVYVADLFNFRIQKFAWVLGFAVASPNGGEEWKRGSTHTIKWDFAGNLGLDVKIDLYKGGVFDSTVVESTPIGADGSGSYDWQIPGTVTLGTDYRLRITSTTNPSVYDNSNMNFTIRKTLVLAAPNGGEVWDAATTQTISWSYVGNPGPDVKIDLYKGGAFINTIVPSAPSGSKGIGSYKWIIPIDMTPDSDYKIVITSTSKPNINDISDSTFTIAPSPIMTVTSPNGGEVWSAGTLHTITWTYTGDPDPNVKLVLLKGGAVDSAIVTSTSVGSGGTGSYDWLIPSGQTVGSDYRVKVVSTKNGKIFDSSNANFRIAAQPTFKVTAPNGGEVWNAGTIRKIKWTYTAHPDPYVNIDLYKAGAFDSSIASSVAVGSSGSGSYDWFVPSNQTVGANYQIKITSTTNPVISDMSNSYFKIAKLPAITVTSPNGGETWQAGTTQTITWTYTGKPDPYVKIDLYRPGLLYSSITSSTSTGSSGTGSYSWSIPPTTPMGSDYRVIITSTTNPAISDMSDGNFTVGLAGAP